MTISDLKYTILAGILFAIFPVFVVLSRYKLSVLQASGIALLIIMVTTLIVFIISQSFIAGYELDTLQGEIVILKSIGRLKMGTRYVLGILFLTNTRLVFRSRRLHSTQLDIPLGQIREVSKYSEFLFFPGIRIQNEKEIVQILISDPDLWIPKIGSLLPT
jgi:hypothetical protein